MKGAIAVAAALRKASPLPAIRTRRAEKENKEQGMGRWRKAFLLAGRLFQVALIDDFVPVKNRPSPTDPPEPTSVHRP
jgi:hypothetical protein